MSKSEVPAELVAAYMGTQYRTFTLSGDIVLRIGEPSSAMRRLIQSAGADGAAFLTAENPFSEQLCGTENHVRQRSLREDLVLLGATIFDGAGQGEDPSWPAETSYTAIGVTHAEACQLGIKYQQNAIVWIDINGVPELLLLR